MSLKTIAIIIPYFGQWPEWIDLYIESCKHNPTIDWLLFSDCPPPNNTAKNVKLTYISFQDYKKKISDALDINFEDADPYKLCDIKPALGFIHQDEIKHYDYYGFGDIDVIYGDIRSFYNEQVLTHNLISTHWDRISGHLALFKNTQKNRTAFKLIKNWQQFMADTKHHGIDESKFSKIYLRHKKYSAWLRKCYAMFNAYNRNCYFKEQYSTILSPILWINGSEEHPTVWYWKSGKLTNNTDGDREFLYLHFMNLKSAAWLPKKYGNKAAWESLSHINLVPPNKVTDGWIISEKGFLPA
ncbi:hypothetical protein KCM76_09585 [Zooshikella marina]|uniref:DUF6625 family protein n=1 Tax=Zooshikella ganghwensis TaxID=202772 RepID=UPI001BAF3611|nr:DUF6625 family protein [Zooshikella ganghwensis]MBU2706238.1 hypothetical protein [Zooshikella ganghwensis]